MTTMTSHTTDSADYPSSTAVHMPLPRMTVRPARGSDWNRLAFRSAAGRDGDTMWADGKRVHAVVRLWGTSHGKLLPITDEIAWGPGQVGKTPQAAVADMLFAALQPR